MRRWSTRFGGPWPTRALDPAFTAEAVLPPSESFIGDQMTVVDPEAIRIARDSLRAELGRALEPQWRAAYASTAANRYEYSPPARVPGG
jgi:aminopeptidase N